MTASCYSIYVSVAPTLVSLAVALPLAVALQASFPGKRLFSTLYKMPLVVPGIVAAFIVMILFDRGGDAVAHARRRSACRCRNSCATNGRSA